MANLVQVGVARQSDQKPNIIFIVADQWRRQALGFMNQDDVQTPNLDKYARESVVFTNATCSVPVSGPNRGSLFTGKYVINHGIWANGAGLQNYEPTSLGQLCKDSGYTTAYIGKWHMNGKDDRVVGERRKQGFDYFRQSKNHAPFRQPYFSEDSTKNSVEWVEGWAPTYETDLAMKFIEQNRSNPFCVVLSWGPPHTGSGKGFQQKYQPGKEFRLGYGYAAPERFEALYVKDYGKEPVRPNVKPTGTIEQTNSYAHAAPGYFGAVTALDVEYGRIMTFLKDSGLDKNTIVVFTSDHGEMMGSHGEMTKGLWYEEAVGVPCIFTWSGRLKTQKSTAVFNSIDVVPTLMGLIGNQASSQCDGTDYSPMLLGKRFTAPEYAFLEYNYGGIAEVKNPRFWRAVYTERYTYVLCGMNKHRAKTKDGMVLYDRQTDPYQMNPIYKGMGYDEVIEKLHGVLVAHLSEISDPFIEQYWNNLQWTGAPALNVTPVY